MANAPSSKPLKGKSKLLPFYVGLTSGKTLDSKDYKHTHYVLIEKTKAVRMGLKNLSLVKPGNSDEILNGLVVQKNHKKGVGDKKPYQAKRNVTQCKKSIMAYCKATVKNKAGKDVQETYSVGFASSIPLRLIIAFFKKNCPNVTRISTGNNFYQVR